jgi:hypothetical protein
MQFLLDSLRHDYRFIEVREQMEGANLMQILQWRRQNDGCQYDGKLVTNRVGLGDADLRESPRGRTY